jgi:hypothetical protein
MPFDPREVSVVLPVTPPSVSTAGKRSQWCPSNDSTRCRLDHDSALDHFIQVQPA